MSLGGLGLFGGGAPADEQGEVEREDGTYIDGYKVADAEDMNFLAQLL